MTVAFLQNGNYLIRKGRKTELELHSTDLTFVLIENIENVLIVELQSLHSGCHLNLSVGFFKQAATWIENCFNRMKNAFIVIHEYQNFSIGGIVHKVLFSGDEIKRYTPHKIQGLIKCE